MPTGYISAAGDAGDEDKSSKGKRNGEGDVNADGFDLGEIGSLELILDGLREIVRWE